MAFVDDFQSVLGVAGTHLAESEIGWVFEGRRPMVEGIEEDQGSF
jgi:hypothetical protein